MRTSETIETVETEPRLSQMVSYQLNLIKNISTRCARGPGDCTGNLSVFLRNLCGGIIQVNFVSFRWVLLLAVLLVPGRLLASDPFQFWLKGSLVAKASKHFSLNAKFMSKWDDSGDFFYEDNDFGVVYTGVTHWLDLGAYYKITFQKITIPGQDDVWKHEKRPHLNATARFKLFGLSFSDRVQLEYNSLEDLSDFGTIRNKIAINPPFYLEPLREQTVVKGTKVRPFASYEIFITSAKGVSKHRFQGGASFRLSDRIFCDLYYLRQENSNFDSGTNVAGATFKLLF